MMYMLLTLVFSWLYVFDAQAESLEQLESRDDILSSYNAQQTVKTEVEVAKLNLAYEQKILQKRERLHASDAISEHELYKAKLNYARALNNLQKKQSAAAMLATTHSLDRLKSARLKGEKLDLKKIRLEYKQRDRIRCQDAKNSQKLLNVEVGYLRHMGRASEQLASQKVVSDVEYQFDLKNYKSAVLRAQLAAQQVKVLCDDTPLSPHTFK